MAGIDWTWETFPEYLANVERLPKALNYGMYIGHSALRMYAMGRRGLEERATEDDLRVMAHAVAEAMRAGAMGFSTSRASTHVTPDGSPVASRIAEWEEIDRLVGAMAALDAGIFQIGPDISGGEAQRVFLDRLRQGGARQRPADHVRHAGDQAGRRPEPVGLPDALDGRDRRARRPRLGPGDDPLDQRDLLAEIIPAVRHIAGMAGDPRVAAGRAEGRLPTPRCAPAGRRGSPDEAEGQRIAGRRRRDHRSAQARLRQPVPDARRRLGRPERRRPGAAAEQAPGRGDHRSVPGKRQPRLRAAAGQRVAGRRAGPAEAPAHAWRRSPIPARMSARRWARRCRPTC